MAHARMRLPLRRLRVVSALNEKSGKNGTAAFSIRLLVVLRRGALRLPGWLQVPVRNLWRRLVAAGGGHGYRLRLLAERATYADQTLIHALPPIFDWWSNRHLRPQLERFGYTHPEDFFLKLSARTLQERGAGGAALLSIGAGNADLEARLARGLLDLGWRDFTLTCVDLNPDMIARGRAHAARAGVAEQLRFMEADFNALELTQPYDVVIANQSLHHVVALEHLFAQIGAALPPHGRFLVSDMIGRNGHARWPEALALVDAIWAELPPAQRWNHRLRRREARYADWDASGAGFEGVRAQDILPCMLDRFRFEVFIAWANLIDVFVGRDFGPNFDPGSARDRAFIDRVQALDAAAIREGRITPTHALMVARTPAFAGPAATVDGLTPERAVRAADG